MNAGPEFEEGPAGDRLPVRKRLARLLEPAVPRQRRTRPDSPAAEQPAASAPSEAPEHTDPLVHPDPLEHPDPARAADAAGTEALLRCWIRETGTPDPGGTGVLLLPLEASGTALRVPVRHWSATGLHRFGTPQLEGVPLDAPGVDAVTLAALLAREAAAPQIPAADVPPPSVDTPDGSGTTTASTPGADGTDLVARVADSVRRTAVFLVERRAEPGPPPGADPYLAGEQSLLLGHPLHPTPKSREGLTDAEAQCWSPESYGAFPLHWFAVDRTALAADSAWTERGRGVTAEQLAHRLAGPGLHLPEGSVPLPLHPWQARDARHRPAVAALLDAGLLHDLGPHGEPWHPTSSIRTVHRPDAPAMLKLSLGLRITNSRRENLRKEAHRGVEVHRLLRTGLSDRWRAASSGRAGFDVVRDPAWIGVDTADGEPLPGLDTVIRHNPFTADSDVLCVAALTSPRPWPGQPDHRLRSRLADLVHLLAARTGRGVGAVAAEWFLRYLDTVVRPVLWLDAEAGIALEAHQQNTLVSLDADGWPDGGRYRDNQGFYFRESHRDALQKLLPGAGEASDSFVSDPVTDERFAYYLGINNVFGLIGAFGSQQLADERLLLAAFRRFLHTQVPAASGTPRSPLPELLLHTPTLRCKANLLTRLHGLDELVGPVDTQSVYVDVPNPLAAG
ncbi:IucA/IucC family protein [Streptomyces sp. 549]|uniref:IucA/IucC family protein n=1 Tax=Streptomyces sp. 549 TaxID=3049076 RepID=UPI0024C2DB06|nr:IucA/IucC family protein [Streptomyces sp. 549]MDK1476885.1 IucA/IucC family protein [Streptomyces sp. 549]